MVDKVKVALVGTNGIPASYGGAETLFENLVKDLSSRFDITVYCSKKQARINDNQYLGARLKYLPFNANGWQSIIYDIVSLLDSRKSDVIFYFGPGAGFMIPLLRFFGIKSNIIINHGGLDEWEREKYSFFQKLYVKWVHKISGKYATYNIGDNSLYQKSLKKNLNLDSQVIKYGGDNAFKVSVNESLAVKYPFLRQQYYVSVSRAQVDNNLHIVLEAFSRMPDKILVLVSNYNVSQYGRDLFVKYSVFSNIYMPNGIYDKNELNAVRSNAIAYIHSHSRCGTPPSLCEAMCLDLPIIAYEMPVNHETTQEHAFFFHDTESLVQIINSKNLFEYDAIAEKSSQVAQEEYKWSYISEQYANIFENVRR